MDIYLILLDKFIKIMYNTNNRLGNGGWCRKGNAVRLTNKKLALKPEKGVELNDFLL